MENTPHLSGQGNSTSRANHHINQVRSQQRILLLFIALRIACQVGNIAFGMSLDPTNTTPVQAMLALAIGGILLVSFLGSVVIACMLGHTLMRGGGIVLGLLTIIPLIGLICLLVINNKATNELKTHGYKVGLLGAKDQPSQDMTL